MLNDSMIARRLIFVFVLFKWSSLLSSIFIVDAKLMLWSSSSSLNNDNDSPLSEKSNFSEGDNSSSSKRSRSSIRDRLKSFHKQNDESSAATTAAQSYVLSPTKYMELMFHYIQSNIRAMSEYLYSSDPSSSQPSSSSAYALFRHARYKDLISEPKDAWEGFLSAFAALRTGYLGGLHSLVDGVYELGYGTISACIALLGGGSNGDRMLPLTFLSELAYGLRRGADHAADGLYLFAAGAVVGTRNLVVGIARTPQAVIASKQGMMYYPQGNADQQQNAIWDYYSLDYEDQEIRLEEDRLREQNVDYSTQSERKRDTTRNIRRRRASTSVKDKRYYEILGVATDANSKEIRSAYRKEALKRHPDKQSPTHTNTEAMPEDPHIEGFLDLTEAYRILSNDASRDAYDQHGLCFREETILPEDGSHEDYVDLFDELFGATSVRDYVGTILIAPIVNEMFGFGNNHNHQESAEIQNLQQRRRTVDAAKHLRDRVNSFVRGEMSKDEFAYSCKKEANFILQEGGETTVAFLRVIGKTLLEEADQRLGYVLPFVKKTFSDSSQKVKSSFANARVYAPIYFRAALEGLVMGSYNEKESDDPDDCSSGRKSNKEPVDQDAVLDLLWQYVVNDSVATLRGACEKVFADRGARDASLAFVKTPSPIKYLRAEAVRILAGEMLSASTAAGEKY